MSENAVLFFLALILAAAIIYKDCDTCKMTDYKAPSIRNDRIIAKQTIQYSVPALNFAEIALLCVEA